MKISERRLRKIIKQTILEAFSFNEDYSVNSSQKAKSLLRKVIKESDDKTEIEKLKDLNIKDLYSKLDRPEGESIVFNDIKKGNVISCEECYDYYADFLENSRQKFIVLGFGEDNFTNQRSGIGSLKRKDPQEEKVVYLANSEKELFYTFLDKITQVIS